MSSVNPTMTLADLGLDSLMGVEVKQTLERDYDIILAMKEIRQLTINSLRELAGSGSNGSGADTERAKGDITPSTVNISKMAEKWDFKKMMPEDVIVQVSAGDSSASPLFVIHPIEGTKDEHLDLIHGDIFFE